MCYVFGRDDEASPDPLLASMEDILHGDRELEPQRTGTGSFLAGTPEMAPIAMQNAVLAQAKQLATGQVARGMSHEEHYHGARITGYSMICVKSGS